MLNYLKDPNQDLPAEQEANAAQQKEKDYLTVATKEKEVRRSTTILGVLFIIGLICLGIMIKKSAPQASVAQSENNAEELQLEATIARLTGIKAEMFNRMDEIVNKFYEFSDVFQVQVSELVKNPFQLESFLSTLKENSENDTSMIDAGVMLEEEIRHKARGMKLVSVMESEKGVCCMIQNKILYEGEDIDDFVVKKISNDSVLLEMEGIEITLKMSK
ncbi:MAG: hypothetical protein JXA96_09415 [Sedimentisphaerales bacterium]|nr:hypothetical protein [Sedimentisphaerales bacterium]